jgi:hypothetical protein
MKNTGDGDVSSFDGVLFSGQCYTLAGNIINCNAFTTYKDITLYVIMSYLTCLYLKSVHAGKPLDFTDIMPKTFFIYAQIYKIRMIYFVAIVLASNV